MGLGGIARRLTLKGDVSEDFMKIGTVSGLATDTVGIKTVTETFPVAFPSDIDIVLLQEVEITDETNVELGFVEPSAMSVSSFVSKVKVSASGIPGSSLKTAYLAIGH